jgi:hypothetical protein
MAAGPLRALLALYVLNVKPVLVRSKNTPFNLLQLSGELITAPQIRKVGNTSRVEFMFEQTPVQGRPIAKILVPLMHQRPHI